MEPERDGDHTMRGHFAGKQGASAEMTTQARSGGMSDGFTTISLRCRFSYDVCSRRTHLSGLDFLQAVDLVQHLRSTKGRRRTKHLGIGKCADGQGTLTHALVLEAVVLEEEPAGADLERDSHLLVVVHLRDHSAGVSEWNSDITDSKIL